MPQELPQAGLVDALGVLGGIFLPTIAKGVILRRPWMLALAERFDLDRRAVRRMQHLRRRYGAGPVLLKIPGRTLALILDPADVHRVLDATPEPFATDTLEKRAALGHFEPRVSLLSRGEERRERRQLNEQALEAHEPLHRLAGRFTAVIGAEAGRLVASLRGRELEWSEFLAVWQRIVRRIVFGDAAANDERTTRLLTELRGNANWAFLRPQDRARRDLLLRRIRSHILGAGAESLAGAARDAGALPASAPEHQVAHWMFAFEPAAMAAFRALALLATHPEAAEAARAEITLPGAGERQVLPYFRATVLEALRLWPTSPLILRETTSATQWQDGSARAGTGVVIFTPYFHRDDERIAEANRFAPELWLRERGPQDWPLIPFSEGPAGCPGQHVVLLTTTFMLALLLQGGRPRLTAGGIGAQATLPGTLNHFALRFSLGS